MIVFPNCKINLGLNITAKRADGYHDLETVFYPIQLRDALEIIESEKLEFISTGLQIKGDKKDNLCLKAYHLLKVDIPDLPAIKIHLQKAVPMGAGLGGGSSDGAFMLKLLNDKFKLQISEQQLIEYALQLGSDCPFFIINKPCFATGRGELMSPIHLDLSSYKIFIVNPGIHISTGLAFSQLTPNPPTESIKEIISQPVETWKGRLINNFEEPVSRLHFEIAATKNQLYEAGAVYASMTGSGSTVFGIFPFELMPTFSFPADYYTSWV